MDAEWIVQRIRDLSWEPDHTLLREFVSSIEVNHQQDVRVISHLVEHYFSAGDFSKAENLLEKAGLLELNPSADELSSIDVVLLAVTRVRTRLRTCMDTSTALSLLEKLEQIDVFDQAEPSNFRGDASTTVHGSTTENQSGDEMRERWILFESAKAGLYSDLRQCGYYSATLVAMKIRFWLETAFIYLGCRDDLRARRLEISIAMNFLSPDPDYDEQQLAWVQTSMARCPQSSLEKARAIQMYGTYHRAISVPKARQVLEECKQEYLRMSDIIGQLVVDVLMLTIKSEPGDRVPEFLKLAQKFVDIQNFSGAKACVDLAEQFTRNDINRWTSFERVYTFAQPILHRTGNFWSVKEIEICRCIARAFASPRNPAELDIAVIMTKRALEQDLTPAQELACLRTLHDCSTTLLRRDDAANYGEMLLKHRYSQGDYQLRSTIVNQVSASKHANITARYAAPLTANELEEQYGLLRDEIITLEEYYDLDMKHRTFDLAGNKLETLIRYLNTVDIRHSTHRQEAKAQKASCFSRYRGNSAYFATSTIIEMFAQQAYGSQTTGVEIADENLRKVCNLPHQDYMALTQSYLLCALSRRTKLESVRGTMSPSAWSTALHEILRYLRQSLTFLGLADTSDVFFMGATAILLDTEYDLLQIDAENHETNLYELQEFLTIVEDALTTQRRAYSHRRELQTFMESREFEAQDLRRDFYKRVADFFYKADLLNDWWLWHERGRSRALYVRLLQSADSDVQRSPATVSMVESETNGLHELLDASISAEVKDMQQQIASLFETIKSMQSSTKIIILGFHFSLQGGLSLVSINSDTSRSTTFNTSLTKSVIEQWLLENLNNAAVRLQHNAAVLQALRPLGAAIGEMSKENDLLIFLPTFPLDRFPLHAIEVGEQGKLLCERNRIIYAPSTRLFGHCLKKSFAAQRPDTLKAAVFMSAFHGPGEQERIFKSHEQICTQLGFGEPLRDVTKPVFKNQLQISPWIHYHGHVGTIQGNPLKQNYKLVADGFVDDGKLTVAEILELTSQNSPTVVAIACNSSVQDSSQANEQLGLTSALIIAGAATVVGTLWAIPSLTGREFARFFYEDLSDQITKAKPGQDYVNLAEANRAATIRLRKPRGAGDGNGRFMKPSDWGAFTVYGSPFLKFR